MSQSELKDLYKQRIYAGLQREFGEVAGVPGYGGTANEMWMKLASAIADIAMDTVNHIQQQAVVQEGIPIGAPNTTTVGPGRIQ